MEEINYKFESLATKRVPVREPVPALSTPIYLSSTFIFDSAKHASTLCEQKEVKEGESQWIYSRWGNPTNDVVERLITSLEGGAGSILTASGMSAISTTILALLKSGDHAVVTRHIYGGTYELFNDILPKLQIEVTWVNQDDINEYVNAIKPNTKLFYGETIANPTMTTLDIKELVTQAQLKNITTVLDCTFSSVYNAQPIKQYGVDVVLHSATKYYGGHSDLIAGSITVKSEDLLHKISHYHRLLGGIASPNSAHLLQRGIKTIALRMKQHNSNALQIAKFLESHPKVENVYYLGLESHKQHSLAKKQFGDKGYGGMIAFEVKGGLEPGKKFVENLKLITLAVSLGGIESLINQPSSMTHTMIDRETRLKSGITDGMLRFSVGCEDVDDLIHDLENSFKSI